MASTMALSPQARQVHQVASPKIIYDYPPVSYKSTTAVSGFNSKSNSNKNSNKNNHYNNSDSVSPATTINNHHHMVKQPQAVIMMRSPSQCTDDGDSQYNRNSGSNWSIDSLSAQDEALAALSARAGENVLDSPTSSGKKKTTSGSGRKSVQHNYDQHNILQPDCNNPQTHHRKESNASSTSSSSSTDEQPTGFWASGLAWVQRSRESRRRKNLQLQAEQQLQKIREAECSHSPNKEHPLLDNPTFLQMRNFDGKSLEDHSAENFRVLSPKLSKSGEGACAQLDFADDEEDFAIPKVRVDEESSGKNESPFILTPEQMHQVAIHVLPNSVAYCRWRRIYSLGRDGDSFDGCLRKIDCVPRTLMIVRTTKGEIFGGYADSPWHSSIQNHANFFGSAGASLFSFQPKGTKKVKVFHWTGKNRYIQLCDVSRKMLAFGGGGEVGVFGLAVEEDFQKGSTGPCDTFDNEQLCSEEVFAIVDLEFWDFLTGMF